MMKLRHIAKVRNSNVDKIANAEESPVRLCNYVDVYKNDFITNDMLFMAGTATVKEIKAFRLRVGDVVITKDSEDRNDIGVPALVRSTAEDLVCGYHLTMLRPDKCRILGEYLFWALQTHPVRDAFSNAAYGVTRYGLSLGAMKSIGVPVPDLATQKAIVDFLDRETARIDALVDKRNDFNALLDEVAKSLIADAISGRLIGSSSRRDAGWLGTVPETWDMKRIRFIYRERVGRSATGEEELLSASHLTGVTKRSEKDVNMFLAESNVGYKLVMRNDLVVNTMWAWMGAMGISPEEGITSPSYGVYRPIDKTLSPAFADLVVRSPQFIAEATRRSKGIHSSRLRLYTDALYDIIFPVPPMDDQVRLVEQLARRRSRENTLRAKNEQAISLLQELRASLITAAVTGQIDPATYRASGATDRALDRIAEGMAQ